MGTPPERVPHRVDDIGVGKERILLRHDTYRPHGVGAHDRETIGDDKASGLGADGVELNGEVVVALRHALILALGLFGLRYNARHMAARQKDIHTLLNATKELVPRLEADERAEVLDLLVAILEYMHLHHADAQTRGIAEVEAELQAIFRQ